MEDVGKIFKIRIGHDDDGASLGWHIENVNISFKLVFSKRLISIAMICLVITA